MKTWLSQALAALQIVHCIDALPDMCTSPSPYPLEAARAYPISVQEPVPSQRLLVYLGARSPTHVAHVLAAYGH